MILIVKRRLLQKIVKEVDEQIAPKLAEIEDQIIFNQAKVLKAFQDNAVAEADLNGSTGYGDDDIGRDKLDRVYAQVFDTEDALVRPQFVSGTHTLFVALNGNLKSGDTLTYLTGMPYDTLQKVIGLTDDKRGTLAEKGVKFSYVPLNDENTVDYDQAEKILKRDQPKVVAIQRSRGYSTRKTFTIDQIKEMIAFVKKVSPKSIVFVDNCYGEFLETREPTEVGVDIMAGSLIKNPGGGLALTGGYICGKKHLIDAVAKRLTSPSIGKECGLTFGMTRTILQGLFLAPSVVAGAVKGAIFCSKLFENQGYRTFPQSNDVRSDIIQAVQLNSAEEIIAFCKGVQEASPVDAFVSPEPWEMPGYDDPVIMAAGNFIQGSSIELSADAPIREPYTVFFQGGLTYEYSKIGSLLALKNIINLKK